MATRHETIQWKAQSFEIATGIIATVADKRKVQCGPAADDGRELN